jgi:hypothetical protein
MPLRGERPTLRVGSRFTIFSSQLTFCSFLTPRGSNTNNPNNRILGITAAPMLDLAKLGGRTGTAKAELGTHTFRRFRQSFAAAPEKFGQRHLFSFGKVVPHHARRRITLLGDAIREFNRKDYLWHIYRRIGMSALGEAGRRFFKGRKRRTSSALGTTRFDRIRGHTGFR